MGGLMLRVLKKKIGFDLSRLGSSYISRKYRHNSCKLECPGDEKDELDLHCKVALVIGGITGIGYCVASELLCAGIRHVALTGVNKCKGKEAVNCLNNTHGRHKASYYESNINCVSDIQDTFQAIMEENQRIDVMVNCAGLADGTNWEKEIITNLVGTMRGTLLAYRFMGKEGEGKGGTVINLAGTCGLEPLAPVPTFTASQHGIVGFSRSFGHDSHVNRSGIRVITLCTGFTKTDFLKRINEKAMTETLGQELESTVKLSKTQNPDVCGQAVMHLLKCAKSGTVWVCEGSKLYSLDIPSRTTYSTLIAQYLC